MDGGERLSAALTDGYLEGLYDALYGYLRDWGMPSAMEKLVCPVDPLVQGEEVTVYLHVRDSHDYYECVYAPSGGWEVSVLEEVIEGVNDVVDVIVSDAGNIQLTDTESLDALIGEGMTYPLLLQEAQWANENELGYGSTRRVPFDSISVSDDGSVSLIVDYSGWLGDPDITYRTHATYDPATQTWSFEKVAKEATND